MSALRRGLWAPVALSYVTFILVGLSLPAVLDGLGGHLTGTLLLQAAAIVTTVIVARFVWVFPATYLPRMVPAIKRVDPNPPWQAVVIVSWSGLRGVVSPRVELNADRIRGTRVEPEIARRA